jgi:hypothetical protein
MIINDPQASLPKIFQLRISLNETQPPIWRRIQVPGDVSLFKLHFIFQVAMGWTNSHLHEFQIGDQSFGMPDEEGWDIREVKEEKDYRLEQVIPNTGYQFGYLYDFGDSWEHTVLVEDILETAAGERYPACLDGARACPPEDVGGTRGYEEFLAAIADPGHPNHDDDLAWAGGAFDPEAFDLVRIDAELKNLDRSEMVRIYQRYYSTETGPELTLYQGVSAWIKALTTEERAQLEALPLRRDTTSLLTYLRSHRTTGTKSTGNLPLKAIREATVDFVHPPELDSRIGDQVYRLRSEYEIWPVYFIHSLLVTGGLLAGGAGRSFRLTPKGEKFLGAEPPFQVWFLLETWWYHTNWMIAYPFEGMGEGLPYEFDLTTLDHLVRLPAERVVSFKKFADRLIQATGLKWRTQDMSSARKFLHSAIERMVIDILVDFQAVEREEEDASIGKYRFKKVKSFTITHLGQGLLKAIAGDQLEA